MVQAEEKFSYLYIQGDKQTPFYVKLEDAMQPRFGKNYCIIPKMAPGPANIEILFQQNAFPAQKFTVLIPENGNRGFLLVRSEANGFMLYDLQQGFYLPAGNKAAEDRMPEVVSSQATSVAIPLSDADTHAPEVQVAEKPKPATTKPSSPKVAPAVKTPVVKDAKPVFIGDLTLSKGNHSDTGHPIIPAGTAAESPSVITNTDCPTPISSEEFGKIFAKVSAFSADEEKFEYLMEQMDKCYETWQARTLTGKLSGDAARYELLRKIYPRITDQAAFPALDDLLTSETWKAEFNRLVHR
jgi:hypothetical protein